MLHGTAQTLCSMCLHVALPATALPVIYLKLCGGVSTLTWSYHSPRILEVASAPIPSQAQVRRSHKLAATLQRQEGVAFFVLPGVKPNNQRERTTPRVLRV